MKDYGRLWDYDLSSKTLKIKQIPDNIIKKYLGGRGLASYLMFTESEKGVDPLSPDNIIMFISGPLTGTPAPGAGKYLVATKSPATGGWSESYSSGALSTEMRYAGCDVLIIRGKAETPSIISLTDNNVELIDATDLWGIDTYETEHILKRRYGNERLGIACIGPAGENLIISALINSDTFRQAGRGGVGAVMGSKNLKALIANGTKGISCMDKDRLLSHLASNVKDAQNDVRVENRRKFGTSATMLNTNRLGMLPTLNYQKGTSPEAMGKIDANGVKDHVYHTKGCISCITPCGIMTHSKGPLGEQYVEGPEYETLSMLGSNVGIYDLGIISASNIVCDKEGLDTISTGNTIAFAMECFEKGLIDESFTGGLKLTFGNADLFPWIISDIAHKRGFGAKLALGVRALSKEIGQGSEHFAMHTKGLEYAGYDPRAAYGGAVAYAVAPRGGCHRRSSPMHVAFATDDPLQIKGHSAALRKLFVERSLMHTLLVCDFVGRSLHVAIEDYIQYIEAVLGLTYTKEEFTIIADRIETTIRLYNIREGLTKDDDIVAPRIVEDALPDGPGAGKSIGWADFYKMLEEYYLLYGWDKDGIPTKETLRRLDI